MKNDVLEQSLYHDKVYIVNKGMCSVDKIVKYIKDYEYKG